MEQQNAVNPELIPEPPKPIIEQIPEDIMKHIRELGEKKNNLLNQFLNISAQVVDLQTQQKTILDQVKSNSESVGAKIKYAYDKLRLGKKLDYNWKYDGRGNFIGQLKPKPKE